LKDQVTIIGPGRMGLALGVALRDARALDRLVFMGRGLHPPPHPLFEPLPPHDEWEAPAPVEYRMAPSAVPEGTTVLLLAVPESALPEVVYELARFGAAPPGCVALHLSGVLSTDVLEPLHRGGYAIGSLHPLQAVADPWLAAERLHDVTFTLSGEPAAVAAGRRLAHALGGATLVIAPNLRTVYHAGVTMASSYLVALIDASVRVLAQAGIPEDAALRALVPLLHGTLENVRQLGIPAALTGPIPRGDADVVRLHLARLSGPERVLYCDLGRDLLEVARGAGLDAARADEIEAMLASD
jgi:predicted short-subunit dehydrogenase-like oxidoreductase (DUF2520 family)